MTATETQTPATTRTCPPSAVVDMIKPWFEVYPGDLVLYGGQFHLLVYMWPAMPGKGPEVGVVLLREGVSIRRCVDSNAYTAVRRYTEGLVTITAELAQTAAAGLDEAADDREYRSRPSGCPECAVLVPGDFCPEHEAHISRAIDYRQARDALMEAGR